MTFSNSLPTRKTSNAQWLVKGAKAICEHLFPPKLSAVFNSESHSRFIDKQMKANEVKIKHIFKPKVFPQPWL